MWYKYNILRRINNIYASCNFTIVELAVLAVITLYLLGLLISAIIMK